MRREERGTSLMRLGGVRVRVKGRRRHLLDEGVVRVAAADALGAGDVLDGQGLPAKLEDELGHLVHRDLVRVRGRGRVGVRVWLRVRVRVRVGIRDWVNVGVNVGVRVRVPSR